MSDNLIVRVSPHIHSKESTASIMGKVLIALVPASAASVYIFGIRALLLITVCILACVLMEHLTCKILKRESPIYDLSAAVTGLLIALNLPVTLPVWMALIGCFVAIVVVKQLFGGIGQNFVNPALTARVVLLISFTSQMTTWALPRAAQTADAVTGATPLGILGEGGGELTGYMDLLWGLHGGSLGETCIVALLLGGLFLVLTRVISPLIPLTYLGGVALLSLVLGQDPLYQLLAGGVVLGAIFMATDYSTCPLTNKGKFIYALGCAVFTVVIRFYGNYPEGTSFAILFMNILTPLIDRYCPTRPFGARVKRRSTEGGAA